MLEVARRAPDLAVTPWHPATELGGHVAPRHRPRVGVAGGAAFSFGYTETSELLAAAGAEVVPFDPVHDARLPEGLSGLVIGGGFPEVHAAVLAANAGMRRSVAQLAADGGAIAAECAGLLYLGEELDGQPMCGVLPVTAALGPRLTLGYRTAVALTDSVLSRTGERVTGHEFHRTGDHRRRRHRRLGVAGQRRPPHDGGPGAPTHPRVVPARPLGRAPPSRCPVRRLRR